MSITKAEALSIIAKTNGAFYGLTFKARKTGEIKKMICKNGVTKHLKSSNAVDRMKRMRQNQANNLLSVYSLDRQGYRSVGLETITEVRANGEVFSVDS